MKKITIFHIVMIIFISGMFFLNNTGLECEIQVINNMLLGMLTIGYIIATMLTLDEKTN